MAVQLPAINLQSEVGVCRHCDQPLNLRPIPSPIDPWSTASWWTLPAVGDPSVVCPGAGAQLFDCPACWGMRVTSHGRPCRVCGATGRLADHEPAAVSA